MQYLNVRQRRGRMSDEEVSKFVKGLSKTNRRFEDQWLAKFSKGLEEVGNETRKRVLDGSNELLGDIDQRKIIDWTREAMNRLDAHVGENERRRIMTGCACHFPEQRLMPIRAEYQKTKDIDKAQGMLRELFVSDLRNVLKLDDELVENILSWGWGVAGVRKGDTIIETKMPFELREHLASTNPQEKRFHYCHCPRIRQAIKSSELRISKTYCYCGAGFYKHIWETILREPVEVEVLEIVLDGGKVCRIAVHLPINARSS
jgi:hypothetical protein